MLAGDFTDVCSWMTTLDDNFGRNLTKDVQEKMVTAWKLLSHEKRGGGAVLPEKLDEGMVSFLKPLPNSDQNLRCPSPFFICKPKFKA